MQSTPDFKALVAQFAHPEVDALVLMGSFARDEAGPFSDVDLVRFLASDVANPPGKGSHLINGRLTVVSQATPTEVDGWFTRPELAVEVIAGLRAARPLHDPKGIFATIQQRAHNFVWDNTLQQKANQYASRQMVGWIEEVHKGMEGLRRQDVGRLLNARYGLTWGLARLLTVQRGILLHGDNAFYQQLLTSIGENSEWAIWWRRAFAVAEPNALSEQIVAGLHVYILTAELLDSILQAEQAPMIRETAVRSQQFLSSYQP